MAGFLIDASLPGRTVATVTAHGHSAIDVRDIGMATATDPIIAAHAKANRLVLLTVDMDFANILDYPPSEYPGIVVVRPPGDASGDVVLALIEQFLAKDDIVNAIAGRLAIVEPGRVRLRPPI